MRWLLLEKIQAIHKGQKAITSSIVPASPYSAEVLFVEMMAQTGGLLVGAESDYQKDLIFAKIENATIESIPSSGTPIQIEAWSESLGGDGGWLETTITCAEGLVTKARLLLMAVSGLSGDSTTSVTFHEAFMKHFNVREKVTPPFPQGEARPAFKASPQNGAAS